MEALEQPIGGKALVEHGAENILTVDADFLFFLLQSFYECGLVELSRMG